MERELIAGIVANPDDDAPRAVYADWLSERGDERGAFLHDQLRLASLPRDDDEWWTLNRRVEATLDRRTKAWCSAMPRIRGLAWGIQPSYYERRQTCFRGMVEGGTFSNAAAFRDRFDEAWTVTPLQHVRVNRWSLEAIDSLSAPTVSERIRGLWLTGDGFSTDSSFVRMLQSPNLEAIRTLRLHACWSSFTLGDLSIGRDLERLHLHQSGPEGALHELADWPDLSGVRSLSVSYHRADDDEMHSLAASAHLSTIESLSLSNCHIGPAGATLLLGGRPITDLAELSLAGNPIGPDGFEAIARAEAGRLRVLDLSEIPIGRDEARVLAGSRAFEGLDELRISGCLHDDLAAAVLAEAPGLATLKGLVVRFARISPTALLELILSPHLQDLQYVVVSRRDLARDEDGNVDRTLRQRRLKTIRERFPHVARNDRDDDKPTEFATSPELIP